MRTPLLLDVPKDSPSRKQTLAAFKKAFNIFTHNANFRTRKEHPWSALLCPRPMTDDEAVQHIASYCRILDEARLLVTGETERDALRTLCQENSIPCYL